MYCGCAWTTDCAWADGGDRGLWRHQRRFVWSPANTVSGHKALVDRVVRSTALFVGLQVHIHIVLRWRSEWLTKVPSGDGAFLSHEVRSAVPTQDYCTHERRYNQ
jgi:hypothetical protein